MDVGELLRHTVEVGASDLHLKAGNVPFVRVDGELRPTPFGALGARDTEAGARALMPEHKRREFEATREADFGYTMAGVGRFRVNVFQQRSVVGLAIRRVRSEIPTAAELMLPPVTQDLAESSRGLVLVTGPTGTGKTTTIASMVGHINRTRRAHIITIEDPIEVVHDDDRAIIQQREVGLDTGSYAAALRHVVRQDPDVIFVGEIRDPESALSAIQAAETGHLVITTMHTIDATETINRLLDLFPSQQQREVRTSFAGALRGIVSQRLVPRTDDMGRVPAVEVLIATGRVRVNGNWIEADHVIYGWVFLTFVTLLLRVRGNTETERWAMERRREFDARVAELLAEAARALDDRCMLQSPETARELAELRRERAEREAPAARAAQRISDAAEQPIRFSLAPLVWAESLTDAQLAALLGDLADAALASSWSDNRRVLAEVRRTLAAWEQAAAEDAGPGRSRIDTAVDRLRGVLAPGEPEADQ